MRLHVSSIALVGTVGATKPTSVLLVPYFTALENPLLQPVQRACIALATIAAMLQRLLFVGACPSALLSTYLRPPPPPFLSCTQDHEAAAAVLLALGPYRETE